MDARAIAELIDDAKAGDFAREFLQAYLDDGFGAMTKRQVELLVFHLLEAHGSIEGEDNNGLSLRLQVTEARVRALRYESKLRYPPTEERYLERRILWALSRSEFDAEGGRIRFIIEDPYVQKALNALAKRAGGVPDSSFNSEIVQIKPDHLARVLHDLFGAEIADAFRADFAAVMRDDSRLSFAAFRKKFVLGAAGALGSSLVKIAKAWFVA
ncbi:MAG: hypothetical protein PF961_09910 [Planctomycetota bacterium]|jgi:hypothetical protein|nr:hypothetical protein [Planctomycetota bacterium]